MKIQADKMRYRIMSILMIITMFTTLLTGCGSGTGETKENGSGAGTGEPKTTEDAAPAAEKSSEEDKEGAKALSAEGAEEKYADIADAPSFKLGFIHTSFSDQLGTMYQKYAEYAASQLGCEIIFAEASDADARMGALENMIEMGCQGVIASNVSEPMLHACEESQIYLIMVGNSIADESLQQTAYENKYYIGSVLVDNYEVGYSMAQALYEQGCRNVAYLTYPAGKVTTFDERRDGIEGFIEEHQDMKVATVYSGTDMVGGAEQVLASYSDIDGLMSVMHNTAIASAIFSFGLAGQIKYGGVDIQEGTDELLKEGTMAYVAGGAFPNAEICVAMLYNYLTGFELWEDSRELLKRPLVELESEEDYQDYMYYMEGDVPVYSGDELKDICGYFNPDVTWEDVVALAQSSSLEDVKARHGDLLEK